MQRCECGNIIDTGGFNGQCSQCRITQNKNTERNPKATEVEPEQVKILLCDGLNSTAKQIHEVAKSKGFWDSERNVGELLMLCVSELGEGLEAHRKGKRYLTEDYPLETKTKGLTRIMNQLIKEDDLGSFKRSFEGHVKDTFEDEIADTIIRLLDLAAGLNIDIEKHMEAKFMYNQTRERLHGKAY